MASDMERVHEAAMKLFPMLGWMASPVFGTLSGRFKKDRLESFSEAGLLTCDGCAKVHFGSHKRPRHDGGVGCLDSVELSHACIDTLCRKSGHGQGGFCVYVGAGSASSLYGQDWPSPRAYVCILTRLPIVVRWKDK